MSEKPASRTSVHDVVSRPNPGSDEAIRQGCKCPILDNGHGQGYMGQSDVFVTSEACPLHWPIALHQPQFGQESCMNCGWDGLFEVEKDNVEFVNGDAVCPECGEFCDYFDYRDQ